MSVIYPVGGGKGGIGKSFISANLGCLFAQQGHRVLLIDLDLGGSNLHTLLGMTNPEKGLHDFLCRNEKTLEDVALSTKIPGLSVIVSKQCSMEIANLYHAQKIKIINAIYKLDYDYILIDLGAGTSFNTLDFFMMSDDAVLIFSPEPTSIEIGVRFVKAVCFRKLKRILKELSLSWVLEKIAEQEKKVAASDIIDMIVTHVPEKEIFLREKLREINFKIVVNQSRKLKSQNLGEQISRLCNRHFYSNFSFVGNIAHDERVYDAVISKQIFVNKFPYTETAMDLQSIASMLEITVSDTPVDIKKGVSGKQQSEGAG